MEGGERERLFSAVAELLGAVASVPGGVGLVVEDVHWADSDDAGLPDCAGAVGRLGRVTVVVTCRVDEAPLDRGR